MTCRTADTPLRSRGAIRPSFASSLCPLKAKRAQGRPGARRHPRSAARGVAQKNRTAAYRCSQSLGLPCAVVGRLMPCSPGSRVPAGLPRPCEIHRRRAG
ncbi:hypothetical protein NK6_1781 [Bradyrhizobium diazoefficiens]|uniref:Uncharacterized protein n=1 Tax=Bradyrhizobium diazoefficiens TaxID=1355477 RepID=A0A0E3VT34_9BRAD|nr:hypothetical protein NK6_1781 [Bradyrhizobium diazoefficiens]